MFHSFRLVMSFLIFKIVRYQDTSCELPNKMKGMVWCGASPQKRDWLWDLDLVKICLILFGQRMKHLGIMENVISYTLNSTLALPEIRASGLRNWKGPGAPSFPQCREVNSECLAPKARQWMSDHLHCNIFMSHISSNTSVTRNADMWYVGETGISTSSPLLREIGKIFIGEFIFSMSRFPSWLDVNFLTGLKKTTQKCSNSNSYFPACHWHGKGSSHRQIHSHSHILPLGAAALSQGCQPRCPCGRSQPSLPLPRAHLPSAGNAAGQQHPATGGSVFAVNVSMRSSAHMKHSLWECQRGFTCASLPQKQQEILSNDTSRV